MRHAYLVIAHTNWKLFDLLMQVLDADGTDFYLLIDKKVKEPASKLIHAELVKSRLIEVPRIEINWGGYSQIQGELNLLRAALPGKYDYYHFLQGSDFPIKDKKDINAFFEANRGKEFIHFSPESYEFAKWKCCYYHLMVDNRFYRKSKALKVISHGWVKIQEAFGYKRIMPMLYHGSALFSITHACAQYIIENEASIHSTFRGTIAADEVFMQTLVMQSPYKDNIFHFELPDGNAYYIDWKHGVGNSPKTLSLDDFSMLMDLPEQYCFARKFSDGDICLAEKVMDVFRKKC